eukprot:1279082-Prymnesium_polylepis.1
MGCVRGQDGNNRADSWHVGRQDLESQGRSDSRFRNTIKTVLGNTPNTIKISTHTSCLYGTNYGTLLHRCPFGAQVPGQAADTSSSPR